MANGEKLRVVSDMDGVIAHNQPTVLDNFNQRFGTKLTYADWTSFDLLTLEASRLSHENVAIVAAWLYSSEVMYKAETMPGLIDALKVLNPMGLIPEIVTSRPFSQAEMTQRWIKNNLQEIKKVHIRGPEHSTMKGAEFKIFMVDQLNANVYIEDDDSVIEKLHRLTSQGQLPHLTSIILVDRPWNDTYTMPTGIRRAGNWRAEDYGWSGIVEILKDLTR